MRKPSPLPPEIADAPFRVMDALARGVTPDRLRARDLASPFRGVRSAASTSVTDAYRPLLRPGERFSHTTALDLWAAPLPRYLPKDVHLTVTRVAGQPRREGARTAGTIGHVSAVGVTVQRSGMPVSEPITAFLESATVLDLDDLVAVGDHLVLDPRVLDQHRESTTQYERDIRRFDAAAELDWRVIRVRKWGLGAGRSDTIARVEGALVRAGWSKRSVRGSRRV